MWTGGVRVIIFDEDNRVLMVRQKHPERCVWMVPGGMIEDGENAAQAAVREVREETGLEIELGSLIWHIEEVSERGQRFVNYFTARKAGGELTVGSDPELDEGSQVIDEVRFMTRDEVEKLDDLYPELLRKEVWHIDDAPAGHDVFRVRV